MPACSLNLLWQHRFAKPGRTLSTSLRLGLNNREGESSQLSENFFFEGDLDNETLDQRTLSEQAGITYSTRLAYAEPLGERGQLEISYRPSLSESSNDRFVNSLDPVENTYSLLETNLSNQFESRVITQRAGLSYRIRSNKGLVMVGLDAQDVQLSGDQAFPISFDLEASF